MNAKTEEDVSETCFARQLVMLPGSMHPKHDPPSSERCDKGSQAWESYAMTVAAVPKTEKEFEINMRVTFKLQIEGDPDENASQRCCWNGGDEVGCGRRQFGENKDKDKDKIEEDGEMSTASEQGQFHQPTCHWQEATTWPPAAALEWSESDACLRAQPRRRVPSTYLM